MKEENLIVGYSCNNHCRFCCERGNFGDSSTEEIKQRIDKAAKIGVNRLVFTGGEPTIRKDIIDLIRYAKEKKSFNEIFMITNGRMMSYEKFANKIINAGLTHILFSLHAPKAKIHDFLTRSPGAFRQTVKGMKNAVKQGVVVENNTVLTKYNYKFFPELVDMLLEIGVKYYEAIFVNPVESIMKESDFVFDNLVPKLSDLDEPVRKALKKGKKKRVWSTIEAIPFCHLKGVEEHATELYMAEHRIVSGPRRRLVKDINRSRQVKGKVKPEKCKNCKYFNVCEGVWINYYRIRGDKELTPIKGKKIENKKELLVKWKNIKL